MIIRVTLTLLLFFMCASIAMSETVMRRGGGESISAMKIEIRPEGLFVVRASGASQLIPWDMVQSIEGIQDAANEAAWNRTQPMAEDLWRARTRLQRGDGRLAEPLFEKHFEAIRTQAGGSELSLVVAEGLLRSRLASGALETALPCALETIRLRRAGVKTERYLGLPEIIDEQLWLVPRLPPIATDRSALLALPQTLSPWMESQDAYVSALAHGYASMSDRSLAPNESSSSAIAFVRAALDALSTDEVVRKGALKVLTDFSSEQEAPEYIDAWRRWFSARSMMLQDNVDLDTALIELLHIPAIYMATDPALAARAVALAADVLEASGRGTEAQLLRRELYVAQADVRPALLLDLSQSPNNVNESESDENDVPEIK